MKLVYFTFISIITLCFTNCKSKKNAGTETPSSSSAATATTKNLAELQMEIVQARWPNTIAEELRTGQSIYEIKCTACHNAPVIEEFSEKKWLHEIDDMSPKAMLTADEKLKLTKYVLSYRESKERLKAN
jgi:cytochrome c5